MGSGLEFSLRFESVDLKYRPRSKAEFYNLVLHLVSYNSVKSDVYPVRQEFPLLDGKLRFLFFTGV